MEHLQHHPRHRLLQRLHQPAARRRAEAVRLPRRSATSSSTRTPTARRCSSATATATGTCRGRSGRPAGSSAPAERRRLRVGRERRAPERMTAWLFSGSSLPSSSSRRWSSRFVVTALAPRAALRRAAARRRRLRRAADRAADRDTLDAVADGRRPSRAVDAPPRRRSRHPSPTAGRLQRLRARLARSQNALGRGLLSRAVAREPRRRRLGRGRGGAAHRRRRRRRRPPRSSSRLRTRTKVLGTRSPGELRALLAEELVDRAAARPGPHPAHDADRRDRPAVVLVVGVNGTGKTTTCGKLARVLVADGRTVLLGAADTFRAAAADQLQTWGSRVGAETVRGPEGGDPAIVAFDAVKQGTEAQGRHRPDRHRRPAAHQGRADGRARQGQAGGRAAGPGRRDAARARRHHRPERADPGAGVHRGRRRHRHRADQARRHRARAAS